MRLTTEERALEGGELLTTTAAVVISTALYLRSGHPYLARGVVGDIAGLALLTMVLVTRYRRVRHEALVCLAGIGVVLVADPQWPVRRSSGFLWLVITAGLTGYLAARQRLLSRMSA